VIDPRSLRGQLALAYAAALLVALIAFAAATIAVVDRSERAALDERLETATRAIAAIVGEHHGRLVLDADDRRQFARILGTRLSGAILDSAGAPIATTVVQVPEAVRALGSASLSARTTTVQADGGSLRVATGMVPQGRAPLGLAVAWHDLDDVAELDRLLVLGFALAIPVVAAFAVIAGGAVAARGLRPLVAMAELASEIEAHDLSRRLTIPPRDDELGRLVVTFDRMLDRLQGAFARQRRFTSDASHELRAPLSVIRAEADLMLRRPRAPEEYERALRAIAVQADELEALTRDLLAAARSESRAGGDALVDLAAVAAVVEERLAPLARTQGVTLRRSGDQSATVRADEASLRRVTLCLLHNALKFGRVGGFVDMRVERAGGTVRLSVLDDGPGFSDAALAHATERFWRGDSARGRGGEAASGGGAGSGLGLSIAAALVESVHGTLRLTNEPGGGARVVVELPSAEPFIAG